MNKTESDTLYGIPWRRIRLLSSDPKVVEAAYVAWAITNSLGEFNFNPAQFEFRMCRFMLLEGSKSMREIDRELPYLDVERMPIEGKGQDPHDEMVRYAQLANDFDGEHPETSLEFIALRRYANYDATELAQNVVDVQMSN
jgi:hypothetical protein